MPDSISPLNLPKRLLWNLDVSSGETLELRHPCTYSARNLPLHLPTQTDRSTSKMTILMDTHQDALRRATAFWHPLLPKTLHWQHQGVLESSLLANKQLRAYYDRQKLYFHAFQHKNSWQHLGNSPQLAIHLWGHALLDALRPELWSVCLIEVQAFHESFADLTVFLTSLQLPELIHVFWQQCEGHIFRQHAITQFAPQFGQTLHQLNPDWSDTHCLRNWINEFTYQAPQSLQTHAPPSQLSADPSSFSRLLTATFIEALQAMLYVAADKPCAKTLQSVSVDLAQLLLRAITESTITTQYFSEFCAQVLWADQYLYDSKYQSSLSAIFMRRGLLSFRCLSKFPSHNQHLKQHKKAKILSLEPRLWQFKASHWGVSQRPLRVFSAAYSCREKIEPSSPHIDSPTSLLNIESVTLQSVNLLLQRGLIEIPQQLPEWSKLAQSHIRFKTHRLKLQGDEVYLERQCFQEAAPL